MSGTIGALVGAGKLDLMRSSPLRRAPSGFLHLVEDAEEYATYMGNAAQRVWPLETEHGLGRARRFRRRPARLSFASDPSLEIP